MGESARRSESVDLADTAEVGAAHLVLSSGWGSEEGAVNGGLDNGVDVLEDVALSEDVATGADLEGVAGVVVPVVVDLSEIREEVGMGLFGEVNAYGVQEGVALDLGGTTAGVVDVVALHGDKVAVTVEVNSPVVVGVAGSGVGGDSVDEVVGDGHALGGLGT